MNNLYKDRMLPSLELKKVETEFYSIRLSMAQMVYSQKYDSNIEQNILAKKEDLAKVFEEYKNSNMSDEQKQLFGSIEQSYSAYMENSKALIEKLKTNTSITPEEMGKLGELASNVQKGIDSLVELNAKTANGVVDKANSVYSNSKNIFIAIFGFVAVIIILVSSILIRLLKNSMKQINDVTEKLSNYDFTVELEADGKNEFAQMNRALKIVIENLKQALKEIKDNAETVTSSSENLSAVSEEMASSSQELAKTMDEVARGATSQAHDLQDIVNLIADLTANIENVYKELGNVKNETDNTTSKSNIGKQEMDKLVKSIEEIKNAFEIVISKVKNLTDSVKQIGNVNNVITAISEQTNLLALNAAIEAARAGEQGRGFAVVAEEIRKLAEQSNGFANEIRSVIEELKMKSENAVKTMEDVKGIVDAQTTSVKDTELKFETIAEAIDLTKDIIEKLNHSATLMTNNKNKIIGLTQSLSAVSEENAAGTEEASASMEEQAATIEEIANSGDHLAKIAQELQELIEKFKV